MYISLYNTKLDIDVKFCLCLLVVFFWLYIKSKLKLDIDSRIIIDISFQMAGNFRIMFLLYTFVLPADASDPGKRVFDQFLYF